MDNLTFNAHSTIVKFTTTKKGTPDLKVEGGQVRGKHKVVVTLMVGVDHKVVAALDLLRVKGADLSALRRDIESEMGELTDSDWGDALHGTLPRKKGLLIALQQSACGENESVGHLNAYEAHPIGVSGVVRHKATGETHVRGLVVSETILEADPLGDSRQVESGVHVNIKNRIVKNLGLATGKWRQYTLPADVTLTKAGF